MVTPAESARAWSSTDQHVSPRTVCSSTVRSAVRDATSIVDADGPVVDAVGPVEGLRRLTAEGLYVRWKMIALNQRSMPGIFAGSVDRDMKA